jgi:regulator of protease activity HflC (stomatin/prohibitin superfamily)
MNLTPLYQRPWMRTLAAAVSCLIVYVLIYAAALPAAGITLGFVDGLLFMAAMLALMSMVSQFALPINGRRHRLAALSHLLNYLTGSWGPVIFLRHGQPERPASASGGAGPGVLVADNASAAVFRSDVRFTRAVGPGVSFLMPGEQLAQSLDLRLQVRRLSARAGAVAAPEGQGQLTTLALTADGIPVAVDLAVTFILDSGRASPPRLGRTAGLPPFEFNPSAAERAVYAQTVAGEEAGPSWTDLPLRLAVDLWRQTVKTYPLDRLLETSPLAPPALELIRHEICQRLVLPTAASHQELRGPNGAGHEFELLLMRGIRVLDLDLQGLLLPTEVRQQQIERWRDRWASEADLAQASLAGPQASDAGKSKARAAVAAGVSRTLGEHLRSGQRPDLRETLRLLICDALTLAQENGVPDLAPRLREILSDLDGTPPTNGAPAGDN